MKNLIGNELVCCQSNLSPYSPSHQILPEVYFSLSYQIIVSFGYQKVRWIDQQRYSRIQTLVISIRTLHNQQLFKSVAHLDFEPNST